MERISRLGLGVIEVSLAVPPPGRQASGRITRAGGDDIRWWPGRLGVRIPAILTWEAEMTSATMRQARGVLILGVLQVPDEPFSS